MALADLTLGRFYGVGSFVHGLDARTKLVAALSLMGCCLYARNALSFLLLYGLLSLVIVLAHVPLRYTLANLKFFVWLLALAAIMNLVFTEGSVLVRLGALSITHEGMTAAGRSLARLVYVVVTASLLTLTTPPLDMTEGIARLFGILRRLRLPIDELSLMTALSLSYLPVLADEVRDISLAQMSRGARYHGRGLGVARSAISLLVPVLLSAFRRADRLALAMESRCFGTAGERTSLTESRIRRSDLLALTGTLIVVTLAVLCAR